MSSWFGGDSSQAQAYNELQSSPHKAEISHELLAGGAAFEAARAYEKHVAENGQPESHAKAKEILAGITGAFVDREVETRGLDLFDKEKVKYEARRQAHSAYDDNNGL